MVQNEVKHTEFWVLDVTNHSDDLDVACFVPIKNNKVMIGENLITDRCPGQLLGLIHRDGQEAVEEWRNNNPDWYKQYCKGKDEIAK